MPSSTVWRHAADRNDRKKRPSEAGDIHLREGGSAAGFGASLSVSSAPPHARQRAAGVIRWRLPERACPILPESSANLPK